MDRHRKAGLLSLIAVAVGVLTGEVRFNSVTTWHDPSEPAGGVIEIKLIYPVSHYFNWENGFFIRNMRKLVDGYFPRNEPSEKDL